MIRKISAIVLFILLCVGCAMIASKHQETQKVASSHHHDPAQHNCAACHSISKEEAGTLLNHFGEVKDRSTKKRLFVFTDPDCPYCKKLHEELKKLIALEPNLAIYIKIYPLKMHHESYDKARVLLAADSFDMLDRAFAGKKLPPPEEKDCKEPVDETIKLAESLGIRGTPALVFPDGKLITGFRNAEKMHALLTQATAD